MYAHLISFLSSDYSLDTICLILVSHDDKLNAFRDLLQLHHVHGGEFRGDDHHDPQLPPQAGGHPHYAHLGESMFNQQQNC